MNRVLVLSLAIAVTGCMPRSDHAALMDNVEHAVRLPGGALPLDRYARAYAKGFGTDVVAVFFLPLAPDQARCSTAVAQDRLDGRGALACPPPRGMAAGERRWFESRARLPRGEGGGCAWIDVRFNIDTHRVETVACHAGTAPVAADLRV